MEKVNLKLPGPVLVVSLATAFSLLGDQTLYVVLPTYHTELGLWPYQVGLLLSLNRWIRLLTNHLAERLCKRYSPTVLLVTALALGAALTLVYGTVSGFGFLLLARLLWGLCWSFIRQIGLMTVVDSSPEGQLGRMTGFYSGISRLGSLAGNLLGALGHDLIGFRPTLSIFSGLSLLGAPLGWLARRQLTHEAHSSPAVTGPMGNGWSLWIGGFVVGCVGSGLIISTLGMVLAETVGPSLVILGITLGVTTLNGILLAGRWVIEGLGAPLLGTMADRLGRPRARVLFFILGALALLAAVPGVGTASLALLVTVFFICGTGAGVTLFAEAGNQGPRTVAAYVTAADLGAAAGPVLGWMVPQWNLPTTTIFALGAGFYALAGLVSR